jgi:hypothetical protein
MDFTDQTKQNSTSSINTILDGSKNIILEKLAEYKNIISSPSILENYRVNDSLEISLRLDSIDQLKNEDSASITFMVLNKDENDLFCFNFYLRINICVIYNDHGYNQTFNSIDEFRDAFENGFNIVRD